MQLFTQKGKSLQGLLSIAISFLLFSCHNHAQEQTQDLAVEADFLEISPTEAQVEKKYPGAIEGSVNVDIKAQVSGYLDTIFVKEGDYVQKGQALFRIKQEVFKEQVNSSQATLQAAKAAEENARIELEKIKPLVAGKVYTEMQLQTAEANYASAKAQGAQARAALASSQLNADFSLIKAPVSGYIGRIPKRIGNLVTPADITPLTSLSDINDVFVYFSLSEADFISLMKDMKADEGINTVELITADGTLYGHTGKLEVASGNIDRSTGSMPMKAVFPNPDKLLRSGGMARVILKKALHSAITVPQGSVKDIQNKHFVYTLADSNKVSMRSIEIAGKSGHTYIVKAGLKAGDKVALNRIDELTEGMAVVPGKAEALTGR